MSLREKIKIAFSAAWYFLKMFGYLMVGIFWLYVGGEMIIEMIAGGRDVDLESILVSVFGLLGGLFAIGLLNYEWHEGR